MTEQADIARAAFDDAIARFKLSKPGKTTFWRGLLILAVLVLFMLPAVFIAGAIRDLMLWVIVRCLRLSTRVIEALSEKEKPHVIEG